MNFAGLITQKRQLTDTDGEIEMKISGERIG